MKQVLSPTVLMLLLSALLLRVGGARRHEAGTGEDQRGILAASGHSSAGAQGGELPPPADASSLRARFRQAALVLSAPLRWAVRQQLEPLRHDLSRLGGPESDLRVALARIASNTTAEYVYRNMKNATPLALAWPPLALLTHALAKADLSGGRLVCEFGVYTGTTITHLAGLCPEVPVYGFDSFEGLPERWREGREKGEFRVTRLPEVPGNVTLLTGWFHETLPVFLQHHSEDVGFLHIDCDLYASTRTVLEGLRARIKPGCIIVFDEYFNYPGWEDHEHKAFQEFMATTDFGYEYILYNCLHEQVAVRITSAPTGGNHRPRRGTPFV